MEVKIKIGDEMIDAKIVMMNGDMIVSPKVVKFEPKDGDIIFSGLVNVSIFKSFGSHFINTYGTIVDSVFIKNAVAPYSNIRPATEEEKQKLFDKLAEEGYSWDAERKELVKLKWEPKVGDTYFRPDFYRCRFLCYKGKARYNTMIYIKAHIKKGYCFKTEQECQEFCNRLNEAISQVKP